MTFRTRFAPSPTGPLHLGHAYSAILAHDMARAHDGEFLLRIEDIDQSRSRPVWEQQILEDLEWLGLSWDGPITHQADQMPRYRETLKDLWSRGLLYPCTCSRRDIAEAVSAPQETASAMGPDGPIYPGTCRGRLQNSAPQPLPEGVAIRLAMERAIELLANDPHISFQERLRDGGGTISVPTEELLTSIGDIVLARHVMGTSYHLSVVLDDVMAGITDVVRGEDLFQATTIHVLLQRLLGLTTPVYHHHRLIRDEAGKRLAKRDDAKAIRKYREDGLRPEDIREMVGLIS